jgi:hypothetical protein
MSLISKINLFQDIMQHLTLNSKDVSEESLIKYMVETREWDESESKYLIEEMIKSSAIYVTRPNYYSIV